MQTKETDLSGTIYQREVDMLVGLLKRERERTQNRTEERERERKVDRVSLFSDYSDPSDFVSSLVVFPLDDRIPESERCFSDDEDPVSVVWRQESSSDPRSLACPVDPPDGIFLDFC